MPIGLASFASSLWRSNPYTSATNYDGSVTKQEIASPASYTSNPPGLESILEYNGILLHDRSVVDKYRVVSMDGLQGVDIRDNREANPSDHGETAFDNYLGGRTILLTGRVEAHSIAKLRDLQQALRTAFYSMQERPLIFHLGNSSRDVQIYARMVDKIAMIEEQNDERPWRNFQITLRAADPRFRSVADRVVNPKFGLIDNFTKTTGVLYTNQVRNTRAEINNTGFSYANSVGATVTNARVADQSFGTNNVFQVTAAPANAVPQSTYIQPTSSGNVAITSPVNNKRYGLRLKFRIASISSGGAISQVNAYGVAFDSSGTSLGTFTINNALVNNPTSGSANDLAGYFDSASVFATYPTAIQFAFGINVVSTTGYTSLDFRFGNIMMCDMLATSTTVPTFFDGDIYRGAWTGAVAASPSVYLDDDYTSSNSGFEIAAGSGSYWFDGSQLRYQQLTQEVVLRRNDIAGSPNLRNTIKITTYPTLTAEGSGGPALWVKGIDTANYYYARFVIVSTTQARIDIYKRIGGFDSSVASSSTFAISASTSYWMMTTTVGNNFSASVYASDPNIGSPVALQTASVTLTGSEATLLGGGVLGYSGIRMVANSASMPIDDMRIEPLALNGTFIAVNAGNFLALPKIRIYGPVTNPLITNNTIMPDETATRSVQINGSIPAGSYYEYDAAKGTLLDNTGANQFSKYDISSKQIQYASGINQVSITAASTSGAPQVISTHQDTWI